MCGHHPVVCVTSSLGDETLWGHIICVFCWLRHHQVVHVYSTSHYFVGSLGRFSAIFLWTHGCIHLEDWLSSFGLQRMTELLPLQGLSFGGFVTLWRSWISKVEFCLSKVESTSHLGLQSVLSPTICPLKQVSRPAQIWGMGNLLERRDPGSWRNGSNHPELQFQGIWHPLWPLWRPGTQMVHIHLFI